MSDIDTTKKYAGGFFYNPLSKRVLLQKRDDKAPHHPGIWTIFGGGMEPEDGGDPVKTFIREVKEEMGLNIQREEIKPLCDYFVPSYNTYRYVYYVEKSIPKSEITVGEGEEFDWWSFEEAEKLELGPKTREDLETLKMEVAK